MNEEKYKRFVEEYLQFFRNRYKNYKGSRKELKRTIFDNPKLTEQQKEDFWTLVTNKHLLNESEE